MSLSNSVVQVIQTAEAKALATEGPAGLNVVPVSLVRPHADSIWLFDFFMKKTAENIRSTSNVSLTAWTGMVGVQLRATADYITEGEIFKEAVEWVRTQNPDRIVKGLIVLHPTEVFDVSPGGTFTTADLSVT